MVQFLGIFLGHWGRTPERCCSLGCGCRGLSRVDCGADGQILAKGEREMRREIRRVKLWDECSYVDIVRMKTKNLDD